ncbi:hypothetical protein LTR27_008275 [Elasticomyces elasticus]|nr:hypothetical protein LTR27_008275 [Elasticomyces elasticus]
MSEHSASQPVSAYNEAEIISLVTNIYNILIRQGHYKESEVIWAPPQGHAIDLSVLDASDSMDDRVISLINKLPYGPEKCVAPMMKPVFYKRRYDFWRSRSIDGYSKEADATPTVLLLTEGFESTDPVLVLDVADNTIRCFAERYEGPHYIDVPTEHAPTYLRRVWDNYCTAAWMSDTHEGIFETRESFYSWGPEYRRIFLENYQWPGPDFKKEEWERDAFAIKLQLKEKAGFTQ